MPDVYLRKGDRLPVLSRQFLTDGTATNLTGATVTFDLWRASDGTQVITNGSVTVDNAATGTVSYAWTATDATLAAGTYLGAFTATFSASRTLTAPNSGMIVVELFDDTEATWSYSGRPGTRALDAIRFLVGDTNSDEQLLLDAEILWINEAVTGSATSTSNLYEAAARACQTIASKFAREADKAIGDLKVSMSQRSDAYRKQADEMRTLAARNGSVPVAYAGGITISDKEIDEQNSDLFRGWFSSGQFENTRDGGRSQTIRGVQYFGPGAD